MIKVGSKVTADPNFPYKWDKEEIILGEVYTVSEVCESDMFGKYVKLKSPKLVRI